MAGLQYCIESLLTHHRIPQYHPRDQNGCVDIPVADSIMLDSLRASGQPWDLSYWTYNEPVHLDSFTSQDFSSTAVAPQLNSEWPQQRESPTPAPVPPRQHDLRNPDALLGVDVQQPPYQPASWAQPDWHSTPHVQQFQSNVSTFEHTTHMTAANPELQPSTTTPTSDCLPANRQPKPISYYPDSATSTPDSGFSHTVRGISSSVPPSLSAIDNYGYKKPDGSWSCAWPDCKSRAHLVRACDLRKHYRRHLKLFLCRYHGCPKSIKNGFSAPKDRARHEAKHNPSIPCEWKNCDRVFSRVDNMVSCPLYNLHIWYQYIIKIHADTIMWSERSCRESPQTMRGFEHSPQKEREFFHFGAKLQQYREVLRPALQFRGFALLFLNLTTTL